MAWSKSNDHDMWKKGKVEFKKFVDVVATPSKELLSFVDSKYPQVSLDALRPPVRIKVSPHHPVLSSGLIETRGNKRTDNARPTSAKRKDRKVAPGPGPKPSGQRPSTSRGLTYNIPVQKRTRNVSPDPPVETTYRKPDNNITGIKKNYEDYYQLLPEDLEFMESPLLRGPMDALQKYRAATGEYVDIELQDVESAQKFFFQNTRELPELIRMTRSMKRFYGNPQRDFDHVPFDQIYEGGFYAAQWNHEPDAYGNIHTWIRVKVFSKPKISTLPLCNGVYCALIDYGGVHFFETQTIFRLRKLYNFVRWFAIGGNVCLSNPQLLYDGYLTPEIFRDLCNTSKRYNMALQGLILGGMSPNYNQGHPFPVVDIFIKTKDINSSFFENIFAPQIAEERTRAMLEQMEEERRKRNEALEGRRTRSLPDLFADRVEEEHHEHMENDMASITPIKTFNPPPAF